MGSEGITTHSFDWKSLKEGVCLKDLNADGKKL